MPPPVPSHRPDLFTPDTIRSFLQHVCSPFLHPTNAPRYFPSVHSLITAMSSYPKSFDLPQASDASRSPQALNAQNTAGSIRDPSKTVMNALENPFLPGSDDWEFISYESKAGTETVRSQTTATNVDAATVSNTTGLAQSGLSKPNVDALNALGSGLASYGHKASYANVDERRAPPTWQLHATTEKTNIHTAQSAAPTPLSMSLEWDSGLRIISIR